MSRISDQYLSWAAAQCEAQAANALIEAKKADYPHQRSQLLAAAAQSLRDARTFRGAAVISNLSS